MVIPICFSLLVRILVTPSIIDNVIAYAYFLSFPLILNNLEYLSLILVQECIIYLTFNYLCPLHISRKQNSAGWSVSLLRRRSVVRIHLFSLFIYLDSVYPLRLDIA